MMRIIINNPKGTCFDAQDVSGPVAREKNWTKYKLQGVTVSSQEIWIDFEADEIPKDVIESIKSTAVIIARKAG